MFTNGAVVDADAALAPLRAGVDDALGWDLHSASDQEIVSLLVACDVERNRVDAVQRRVLAEFENRRLPGELGSRSTGDALMELLRISRHEASGRVKAMRTFGPRVALTGELLEPVVPLVAAALETGQISVAHGMVIADLLDALPGDVEAAFGIEAQEFLLEQAGLVDPVTLGKIAQQLRDTLDQDGAEDRSTQTRASRSFHLISQPDGSFKVSGRLTPAAGTALQTALDPLSAPCPSELGEKDPRSFGQRQHDALEELTKLSLKSGKLPASGGVATTILVTTTIDQLRDLTGVTTNAYGDLLPMRELAKLAAEAELVPVVFDDLGAVMAYGSARRIVPPAMRRALAARDKGCIIPGCTRPPSQCEAHHVTRWEHGGPTDINNLALLCDYDHDTFQQRGWTVTMIDGVPWCTPPPWLDPEQTPRRNTAHDTPLTPLPEQLTRAHGKNDYTPVS